MTAVLEQAPPVSRDAAPSRRRRRRVVTALGALAVLALASWVTLSQRPPLTPAGWTAGLDARPLEDGVSTTRFLLPLDGQRVVLTSIVNDGPLPVTVTGLAEGSLPWMSATFQERGASPRVLGHSTAAAARAAVTSSSVTLGPGEMTEVLVTFDPPPDLVVSDGASLEQDRLALSVRYLGLPSTRDVPLLSHPLVLVPASTAARLEREGRLAPQG